MGCGLDVIAQTVSWQAEPVNSVHYIVRVQTSVGIVRVLLVEGKGFGFRHSVRKVKSVSVLEREEFSLVARISFGVIVLNETASTPNQVETHQIAPVIRMFAFFKGC